MDYKVVIGLEIHAELCTKTKAFCSCRNSFGDEVNTNCCPNCMGFPGTLPTLNQAVVDFAIKAGHAMNCTVNPVSKFDRKNYFYPDLAKGYQTTQMAIPICEHGYIELIEGNSSETKRIGINRIHIEEDTAKLIHDEAFDGTLIDFNRSGVPLIEIVSEPDLRSAKDTKIFLDTVRAILVSIGVSDGKMQEGSIRCDVNVSVMPLDSDVLGTRTEMKNVNTFSGAVRAVEYETARQIEVITAGGKITQETRRWDDEKGVNFLMRSKENANDYGYFPEPDLLTLVVEQAHINALKDSLPELPNQKIKRLIDKYDIPYFDANLLVENPDKCKLFEECAAISTCKAKNLSNWILGDISRILKENAQIISDTKLTATSLCEMVALIESGEISSNAGKTIIEVILVSDTPVKDIVREKSLSQVSDTLSLEAIVREAIEQNPQVVEQYKSGKTNVVGFIVGICMKKSKGQGNPVILQKMVLELLGN